VALPLSRNRTYSNGDPVIPGDLNDLQDQAIALYGNKHGTRPIYLPGSAAFGTSLTYLTGANAEGRITMALTTARAFWALPQLVAGSRITAIRLTGTDNVTGTTQINCQLYSKVRGAGSFSESTAVTNGSGTLQTVAGTAISRVVAANESFTLVAKILVANICTIDQVEVDYDHP